jgi:hypothetical protein
VFSSTRLARRANATSRGERIRFGDLRRLKRDILPARITTQEEAEVLIALDAVVEKADREWRSYLIGTVRDFVVWGLSPVGRVDHAKAEWLVAVLSSGVARKTARTLAREIAREAKTRFPVFYDTTDLSARHDLIRAIFRCD